MHPKSTEKSMRRKAPRKSTEQSKVYEAVNDDNSNTTNGSQMKTPTSQNGKIHKTFTNQLLDDYSYVKSPLPVNGKMLLPPDKLHGEKTNPHDHLGAQNPSTRVRTPEISSIRSRRADSPARSISNPFKRPQDLDNEDRQDKGLGVQRFERRALDDEDDDKERASPVDPASVSVYFSKLAESPAGEIQETSTPAKDAPQTPNKPLELEEHLANAESTTSPNANTSSGLISSIFSAAHNAASHIISSKSHTDIKSHPKNEETEALTTQGSTTTFVQQLDSLLFGPVKKSSTSNPKREIIDDEDEDDLDVENASMVTMDSNTTRSNIREVNFQPIRKSNLSTMGKGELRLEDLGAAPGPLLSRVISPVSLAYNPAGPSSQYGSHHQHPTQIPSVSVTSDESPKGKSAHPRVVSPITPQHSAIAIHNNNTATCPNATVQFDNATNTMPAARARSPHQDSILRPNSMPLQSLEILNGSKSFTDGLHNIPAVLSNSRSASTSPSLRRDASPARVSLGKRGRAKSLGSSLTHPNASTTGTASVTRPLSEISQQSLQVPNARSLDDDDEYEDIGTRFSIGSRSSSIVRLPTRDNATISTISELKNVTYANSKRDTEFHNIFIKIPSDERLIDDFACALQKDILIQGRMYLSTQHICFKANILGWVTNIIIPLKEIVRLEKRNTVGVFRNAIAIQTLHSKFTFASFLSRDLTFELITNVWNQVIRGAADGETGFLRGVHGTFDSDEDYSEDDEESADEEMVEVDTMASSNSDVDDDVDEDEAETPQSGVQDIGPLKHSPTIVTRSSQSNETKIIDKVISAPVGKVYTLLFGDDTEPLQSIISKQGNKDISPIPAFVKDGEVKKRSYEYVKPLNSSVGPKQTLCQVSESVEHYVMDEFILVTQTTKNPDVPSGNSFVVITQFYLSWAEDNNTKLEIYTYINWSAKSWLKGPIESGTISGQKEALGVLTDELVKLINGGGRSRSKSSSSEADEEEIETLPSMGPKTHDETENDYKQKQGDVFITEETFSCPLGTLYSILFGDDTIYINQIIKAQKNREISKIGKFDKTETGGTRTYNYVKPLSAPVGPKQTKCNITESIESFSLDKSITVLQSTQTPDVPSGNSFTTNTSFHLSWGPNNGSKMYVVTFMNWTGKSWLKGPIEKGAIDGQKESIKILIDEVKSIITNAASGKKRKKSKRGKKNKVEYENQEKKSFTDTLLTDRPQYQFASMINLPQGSFLMFFVVVVILALTRGFNLVTYHSSNSPITELNKVNIKGQDYVLMPLVTDLTKSGKLRDTAEFEIWEWINERSHHTDNGLRSGPSHSEHEHVDAIEKKAKVRDYEDQQIREMIRVVESELAALKAKLKAEDQVNEVILRKVNGTDHEYLEAVKHLI